MVDIPCMSVSRCMCSTSGRVGNTYFYTGRWDVVYAVGVKNRPFPDASGSQLRLIFTMAVMLKS